MPISLILTPSYHFHFRPTSGLLSSQDLTYCLKCLKGQKSLGLLFQGVLLKFLSLYLSFSLSLSLFLLLSFCWSETNDIPIWKCYTKRKFRDEACYQFCFQLWEIKKILKCWPLGLEQKLHFTTMTWPNGVYFLFSYLIYFQTLSVATTRGVSNPKGTLFWKD